ncbi:hypothetical protein V3C99_009381 [Haemonchus contortus]
MRFQVLKAFAVLLATFPRLDATTKNDSAKAADRPDETTKLPLTKRSKKPDVVLPKKALPSEELPFGGSNERPLKGLEDKPFGGPAPGAPGENHYGKAGKGREIYLQDLEEPLLGQMEETRLEDSEVQEGEQGIRLEDHRS